MRFRARGVDADSSEARSTGDQVRRDQTQQHFVAKIYDILFMIFQAVYTFLDILHKQG